MVRTIFFMVLKNVGEDKETDVLRKCSEKAKLKHARAHSNNYSRGR